MFSSQIGFHLVPYFHSNHYFYCDRFTRQHYIYEGQRWAKYFKDGLRFPDLLYGSIRTGYLLVHVHSSQTFDCLAHVRYFLCNINDSHMHKRSLTSLLDKWWTWGYSSERHSVHKCCWVLLIFTYSQYVYFTSWI